MPNEIQLRHELERIERKLAREQQNEEQKAAAIRRARLAKQYSRLDFLTRLTTESLQSSITQAENKQLLLQTQIVQLQNWIRLYSDLLLTRDEQIAEVKAEINRLEGRAPESPEVPTVESIKEQWAYLQGLLK